MAVVFIEQSMGISCDEAAEAHRRSQIWEREGLQVCPPTLRALKLCNSTVQICCQTPTCNNLPLHVCTRDALRFAVIS